ncbi:protein DWD HYPERSENSITIVE TO UV-B 1 isoform X1 [Daucus carota subsp. sativus]|uniref:protein DWD HYPERSENSITIVE TO UV-B 1 isoform X1 n=1 Tax=Daucus carota subsp. sativus TaxID=79200 RepID=UPI0007EFA6CE|nr:PREDICTED: uncharacterized protein LOC108220213 [Daucus carota subsp. sativus]
MAIDIQTIERRYIVSCHQKGIPPNKSILFALFKAKVKKSHHEVCNLVICMDDVKDVDFNPLVRLLMEIDESEINGVDIIQRSSCFMSVENVLLFFQKILSIYHTKGRMKRVWLVSYKIVKWKQAVVFPTDVKEGRFTLQEILSTYIPGPFVLRN